MLWIDEFVDIGLVHGHGQWIDKSVLDRYSWIIAVGGYSIDAWLYFDRQQVTVDVGWSFIVDAACPELNRCLNRYCMDV